MVATLYCTLVLKWPTTEAQWYEDHTQRWESNKDAASLVFGLHVQPCTLTITLFLVWFLVHSGDCWFTQSPPFQSLQGVINVIINVVLNRMELLLSMCMCWAMPSAYLDLCQLWELEQHQERNTIPQVIFTNKELQLIYSCMCFQWTKTQVNKNGKHLPHSTTQIIFQEQWWCTI